MYQDKPISCRKHNSKDFDISLARVEPAIKFGPRVRPTNIPTCQRSPTPGNVISHLGKLSSLITDLCGKTSIRGDDMTERLIAGTHLTLVGYGITKNYARYNYSQVPTKANVTLLTYEQCLKQYCPSCTRPSFTKYTLCSTNTVGVSGPCGGDAGAPVFLINEKDGTHSQVGHAVGTSGASYGRCDNRSFLYVDLAPFAGWIHRRISGCGNNPIHKDFIYNDPKATCDNKDAGEEQDS